MSRGYAVVAALAILGFLSDGASAQCKPIPPQVNVTLPPFNTAIEEVRDVGAYTPFPFRTEQSIEKGWKLNGIALVKTGVRFSVQGVRGPNCYQPITIGIELAIEDPAKIYIDSRYARGTCNYEVIKAHELQHVDVYVKARAAFAPYFKGVVQNAVNAVLAQATRQSNGDELVREAVREAVDVAFAHMNAEAARVNAGIDSRENYIRTQALCPNW